MIATSIQNKELPQLLSEIVATLQIELTAAAQEKILAYLALLQHWNGTHNLTAIRDPREMMIRHIADSLAVQPFLTGQYFIDVGTGAGLPGIPLALALPDSHWTLLDSQGKKTRFLIQAKAELELTNITVVQARVETYIQQPLADGIITRAFSDLQDMVSKTQHLLAPGGKLWAMKGVYPTEELRDFAASSYQVHPLQVPHLAEARHLLCLTPLEPVHA